ncbi:MAG: putative drug exporter of the superfamily, partial [Solirubrobacteraceae bacterium]|nr:putative drug exporter of the superfamily [Solirubrobacteraceae bacterium]
MTHRWQTTVAWLAAVVAATALGQAVGTRDISSFRLPDTESQAAYDLLAAHAPQANGGTDQLVYVARSGTLREGAARARMRASLARVRGDRIVADVSDPLARGGQLTPDGRIGVSTVTYKGEFQEFKAKDFKRVEVAAFSARGADLQVEHGGQGAEFVRFTEQSSSSEFISLIAAALILLLMFGSLIAAGVPLLTAMLALGTTIGLVPVISQVVDTPDFASQLAALMGIGVGIDYALIIVTRYRAEVGGGLSREDAIVRAQDTAGRTVFFAACTVIIALLGLLLLGLSFLHGAAIAAALAVLLTMIGSLTLLPALLGAFGHRVTAPAIADGESESPRWARFSALIER